MANNKIIVRGAREHNLKNVSVEIPRDKLVVFTGLSGSGKSSLAFDTIYAEGQRRYVESLSSYARQFLGQMDKPDVDFIEGLSPAISIDQKSASHNPRSTVGTTTEVYDYLRLLFARVGVMHCINDGHEVTRQTPQQIVDRILKLPQGTRFMVLAPVVRGRKGTYDTLLTDLSKQGFSRVRIDGEILMLEDVTKEGANLAKYEQHTIEVVVDRITLREGITLRLTDSLETALKLTEGVAEIQLITENGQDPETMVFSQHLACPICGTSYDEVAPRSFSFNSPYGACPHCSGLGISYEVDPTLVVPNPDLSLAQGAVIPWSRGRYDGYFVRLLEAVASHFNFSTHTPWKDLGDPARQILLYGTEETIHVSYRNAYGRSRSYDTAFEGIIPNLSRRYSDTDSESSRANIEGYMREVPCAACKGARLRPESLAVTVHDRNIFEVCALSISEAATSLAAIPFTDRELIVAERIIKEINARMQFLLDVGLDYLSLARSAASLSGGEAQRIRLASQIGSGLVGVLYVLDEPSIGLHQRDNQKLIDTLIRLRGLGNTLIVVEHDEDTIRTADWVVDVGPAAGEHGGQIIHSGTVPQLLKNAKSLTGRYLSGKEHIAVPEHRRPRTRGIITVKGARENNLQNLTVDFPLGVLSVVTGVSGSGKSTLVNEILFRALTQKINRSKEVPGRHTSVEGIEQIDKVIDIDQSPIGRTPRSNPATYIGVFDRIRDIFASTPEAKVRGYQKGRFSFNVSGGRCEACAGDGTIKIEMHFLPDVYVPCEVCGGSRYNRDTLDILYKGKNIAEVLDLTAEDGLEFFKAHPAIARHMQTLVDVGLGYIRLGQPSTQLSGGEAQRVKLASELSKRSTSKTFYILDEPTTGLHFEDVRKLIAIMQRLVDQGNSVLIIEHNLDVIKVADWLIDLGPEGGKGGGLVVAEGTPEEVAAVKESYTGQYLAPLLDKD